MIKLPPMAAAEDPSLAEPESSIASASASEDIYRGTNLVKALSLGIARPSSSVNLSIVSRTLIFSGGSF